VLRLACTASPPPGSIAPLAPLVDDLEQLALHAWKHWWKPASPGSTLRPVRCSQPSGPHSSVNAISLIPRLSQARAFGSRQTRGMFYALTLPPAGLHYVEGRPPTTNHKSNGLLQK